MRQAARSAGFLQGKTVAEQGRAYWTLTLWEDLRSMQSFFGSGAHLRAMPFLRKWCTEACVTHVSWESEQLPEMAQALEILRAQGKFAFLPHASVQHASQQLPKDVVIRWEGKLS
jgi:hypothetical protein